MAPAGATRRPTSLLTANGFTRRQVHRLRPDCFLEHPDAPQPVPGLILQWAREEAGGVGGVDHLRPDRAGGDLIIQMAPYAPAQASPTRYAGGSSPGERLERGEEVLGHHQGVTEKPGRALRRRGKDLPGDPGLRGIAAWPLPVTLLLVLVLGSAVVAGAYWLLALLAPIDESSGLTAAQRLTAAFATATALGAMAALVINIRKQDLAEQAARREIASAFTERFRAAASQLGGVSPAERLAGVYAMAALADEYPRRSQQCVDVLCGYLRLPFNPDTDNLASQTSTTATASESGAAGSIASTTATRPFDSQVRQTIVTVIRAHTQPDAAPSWSHLNYDFTGAHLENANFRKAQFTGTAIFDGAQFTSRANFRKAKFTGTAIFGGAQFTGTADFDGPVGVEDDPL